MHDSIYIDERRECCTRRVMKNDRDRSGLKGGGGVPLCGPDECNNDSNGAKMGTRKRLEWAINLHAYIFICNLLSHGAVSVLLPSLCVPMCVCSSSAHAWLLREPWRTRWRRTTLPRRRRPRRLREGSQLIRTKNESQEASVSLP